MKIKRCRYIHRGVCAFISFCLSRSRSRADRVSRRLVLHSTAIFGKAAFYSLLESHGIGSRGKIASHVARERGRKIKRSSRGRNKMKKMKEAEKRGIKVDKKLHIIADQCSDRVELCEQKIICQLKLYVPRDIIASCSLVLSLRSLISRLMQCHQYLFRSFPTLPACII